MFKDLFGLLGQGIGVVAGVAIAPLSIALNCSTELIKQAIDSGYRTEEEIRQFVLDNREE